MAQHGGERVWVLTVTARIEGREPSTIVVRLRAATDLPRGNSETFVFRDPGKALTKVAELLHGFFETDPLAPGSQ